MASGLSPADREALVGTNQSLLRATVKSALAIRPDARLADGGSLESRPQGENGQITLPVEIRRRWGQLGAGHRVWIADLGYCVIVYPDDGLPGVHESWDVDEALQRDDHARSAGRGPEQK